MPLRKNISRGRAARGLAPVTKRKCAPRGRAFLRGNSAGAAHRWKPGQSGNPSGRPKSKLISEALRWMLSTPPDEVIVPASRAETLAWRLIREGQRGKIGAVIECADRTEGRAHVSMSVNTEADPIRELIASTNRLKPCI